MRHEVKGGIGETGIHIQSRERYRSPLDDNAIITYTNLVCQMHGVFPPEVVKDYSSHRWGKYIPSKRLLIIYNPMLGVLLHELAHHIVRSQNGIYYIRSHGPEFKAICQQLFEEWNI